MQELSSYLCAENKFHIISSHFPRTAISLILNKVYHQNPPHSVFPFTHPTTLQQARLPHFSQHFTLWNLSSDSILLHKELHLEGQEVRTRTRNWKLCRSQNPFFMILFRNPETRIRSPSQYIVGAWRSAEVETFPVKCVATQYTVQNCAHLCLSLSLSVYGALNVDPLALPHRYIYEGYSTDCLWRMNSWNGHDCSRIVMILISILYTVRVGVSCLANAQTKTSRDTVFLPWKTSV